MTERRDALVAASRVVLAVREEATRATGRQVGTVGRLSVTPNAPNVVPGRVDLVIEIRDLSESIIDGVFERIQARMKAIAQESGTTMETKLVSRNEGAPATPWIREIIRGESEKQGLKILSLPSGAGHDAQMIARIAPMGMIFVPSVGGISHSPKELTLWKDCANGCEVLYRSVLAIDSRSNDRATGRPAGRPYKIGSYGA
jgi:N-carbamoyl-L-amino-acid hydrolase